ncbi:MAG: ribosome-associated translation inhibitor RaiA [Anaerolineales bacterium]|nr:ribosome-associated translation inhibitor RaiA [Anaerolineales bacterium]
MDLFVSGRNIEITQRLDDYARQKVGKLDRYLPSITTARMDLSVENAKSAADRQVAQLTIRSDRGVILRAEERTGDMFASIDAVMDKMYRQIARYKGKRQKARRGAPPLDMGQDLDLEDYSEADEMGEIVRKKSFPLVPMMQEEAMEQMELLGHDFFVFYNAEEGAVNVLYRRKDGNYGLIMPEIG